VSAKSRAKQRQYEEAHGLKKPGALLNVAPEPEDTQRVVTVPEREDSARITRSPVHGLAIIMLAALAGGMGPPLKPRGTKLNFRG